MPLLRRRVEPLPQKSLFPFVRAHTVHDCSIYWMPVSTFPVSHLQRAWVLEFLKRLGASLKETQDLREEWFLQFKVLYPHLLNLFVERSKDYVPMTGVTLSPGATPVKPPTFEETKAAVERSSKKGEPINVLQWMPDHAHWFAMKQPEAQRNDFFGFGGMFSMYLAPDPKAALAPLKLPRFMTTHEAYTPDIERQYSMVQALQDGFLAQSKQLFGAPYRDDPSYRGLLFILPLLTSANLVGAGPDMRAQWFELCHASFAESKPDKGLLLACKDPDFDEPLMELLQTMRDDELEYIG